MMNDYTNVIFEAKQFVKAIFAGDSSGHDLHHTMRVYELAKRIAVQEGADVQMVELIALLHDVDDHKISPDTSVTCDRAVGFLRSQGVAQERVDAVVRSIGQISFSKNSLPPDTLEGQCVQDADRLDALGAIGIARTFAFGGSRGRGMHDPEGTDSSTSIAHFYDKLLLLKDRMNTSAGRALAQERDAYLRGFLEEFLAEWAGER